MQLILKLDNSKVKKKLLIKKRISTCVKITLKTMNLLKFCEYKEVDLVSFKIVYILSLK